MTPNQVFVVIQNDADPYCGYYIQGIFDTFEQAKAVAERSNIMLWTINKLDSGEIVCD